LFRREVVKREIGNKEKCENIIDLIDYLV